MMNKTFCMNELYSYSNSIFQLTVRNIKIFLKDKMAVLFSLLAPIIVLMLYVFFLGDLQVEGILSAVPENLGVDEKSVKAVVDCWLIAGLLGVSSVTVSLSSMSVMVSDKQNKINYDCKVSPMKSSVIMISYFFGSFVITLAIVVIVFCVGLIYLAASGAFVMSVANVFETFAIILLSTLSSTMIMMFIVSFFSSSAVSSAFGGIVSAVLGFLIGAYMPISTFPTAIQYISNIIPASHATGLFRNSIMEDAITKLCVGLPPSFRDIIADSFSLEVNMFGDSWGVSLMYVFLASSIALFFAINLVRFYFDKRSKQKN